MKKKPTCRIERKLLRNGYKYVIGVDEVGRGAVAGPVVVGVAVSQGDVPPKALADSKLLTHNQRKTLLPEIEKYSSNRVYTGVSSNAEIDRYGINIALRIAALRAIPILNNSIILLDGVFDWLTYEPEWGMTMFNEGILPKMVNLPHVSTIKKGDRDVSVIAAASVYAKEKRDNLMRDLSKVVVGYNLENNKGYLTADHRDGIAKHGLSSIHRKSFKTINS